MKTDLHCHSHFSDGKHSPSFLVKRAEENKITHLAITDHDFMTATTERNSKVQIINGVEISCNWQNREIHVVGIGIDHKNHNLESMLCSQQASRHKRVRKINELLIKAGIVGLVAYLDALKCVSVTRSHVADFLILSGASKNRQQAFNRFLGKGGRAYVPATWVSLPEANHAISASGGIAVLAHPSRYKLNSSNLNKLIDSFKQAGGSAIEVSYGGIHPSTKRTLEETALKKDLFMSAGSDFHDANAHWTDIGKFPEISNFAKENVIWRHPKWHFS